MADPTPIYDYFIARYAEFTSISSALCDQYLSLSTRLLDQGAWGDFYLDAIMLDAAHNILIASQSAKAGGKGALQMAAGPISNVSVGGVSTGFNSPAPQGISATDDWYSKTSYGQQFLRLRNAVIPRMVLTA